MQFKTKATLTENLAYFVHLKTTQQVYGSTHRTPHWIIFKNMSDLLEEAEEALVGCDVFGRLQHSGLLLLSVRSIGEAPEENYI